MALGQLVGRGFVRIDADTAPAKKAVMALGALGSQGGLLALGSLGAQVIGPLTVGVMSLASAFAVAGGAAGVFAAAVVPQFKDIAKAQRQQAVAEDAATKSTTNIALAQEAARAGGFKYGQQVKITADMTDQAKAHAEEYNKALSAAKSASAAATKSQALYKQEIAGMPKATQDTANALQALKDDTNAWSRSLASSTMPIFTRGIEFIRSLLPKLTPIVKDVSREVGYFMTSLGGGQAGQVFREFGKNVTESGAGQLRNFLKIIRNVAVGFVGLLNAFMPTAAGVSGGLTRLTGKFANFGATLGKSKGFQDFIDNAKSSLPGLVATFSHLATIAVQAVKSLGPLAGISLKIAEAFASLLAALPPPVLQLMVQAIVLTNAALKVYAVYSAAAAAATWLFSTATGESNFMMGIHNLLVLKDIIAMKAMLVWQALVTAATWAWTTATTAFSVALNTTGIPLIIIGIAALTAGIIYIATKTTWFQTAWKYTWNAIKVAALYVWHVLEPVWEGIVTGFHAVMAAASAVLDWLKKWWPLVVALITGPVGAAIIIVVRHWDTITKALGIAFNAVVGFFKAIGGRILSAFGDVASLLYNKGKDIITGLIRGQVVVAKTLGAWFNEHLIRPVINFFSPAVQWLYDKGKLIITGLIRGAAAIARTVGGWFRSNILNPVVGFFSRVGGWLYDKGRDLITGLIRGQAAIARSLASWFRNNVISPVVGFFSRAGGWLYDKGKSLISGLLKGAGAGLSQIGKWAKTVFKAVVGAIKHVFGIKSPSTVMAGLGGHMMAGLLRGLLRGSAVLGSVVKKIFSNPLSAARGLIKAGVNVTGFIGKGAAALAAKLFGAVGIGGGTPAGSAQRYATSALGRYGWNQSQFPALKALWNGESGWRWNALNKSSGAYGIPQSLPASKMASAGADWKTNAATQINWGLSYIKSRYGSPAAAYNAWLARSPHWYDQGGWLPPGLSLAMNGTGRPERIRTAAQESALGSGGGLTIIVNVGTALANRQEISDAVVAGLEVARRRGYVLPKSIVPQVS